MNRNKYLAVLIALGFLIIPSQMICGQQSDETSSRQKGTTQKENQKLGKEVSAAIDLMRNIESLIEDGMWKKASSLMTEKAWDDFCAQTVNECASYSRMDLHIPFPGFEESVDAMTEALEKHGLEEVEIDSPAIRMSFNEPDEEAESEKPEGDAETGNQKILVALNKCEDRFKVMADLWAAKKKSPFYINRFSGKLTADSGDENSACLKVEAAPPDTRNESGGGIVIAVPPVFVNLVKQDDGWKYAGTNAEKTQQAAKNFRPQRPGQARSRSDY